MTEEEVQMALSKADATGEVQVLFYCITLFTISAESVRQNLANP